MTVRLDSTPESWEPPDLRVEDAEIGAILMDGLCDGDPFGSEVQDLRREPSPFATLSPADFAQARLADGRTIDLFVKYPGTETARHPDKVGPLREIRLYAGPLAEPGLPVPRCYAVWESEKLGRWVLVLQRVPSWDLRYLDLTYWRQAARKLADLHRQFGSGGIERLPSEVLRQFDTDYFAEWLERTASEVEAHSPGLSNRLAHLLRVGREVPTVLASARPCLVHNDLSPKNVMVEGQEAPCEVRIVDWEMSGIGAAVLDLVHLAYGLPPSEARKLLDRWEAGLENSGLMPASSRDRERLLAAAEGFKILYRAAHCRRWELTQGQVQAFLTEAEEAFQRL